MKEIAQVVGINGVTLGVVTLTHIELVGKCVLLGLTIGYTAVKFYLLVRDHWHRRGGDDFEQ